MFNNFFFENRAVYEKMSKKKYCRGGQATGDNLLHVDFMLDNWGHKHILRICNNYCFSTATMVARKRLNITLPVHCLSCLIYTSRE